VTGWLAPSGKFYQCLPGGHAELARVLGFSGEDVLDRLGWLKALAGQVLKGWHPIVESPTQRQMDSMINICGQIPAWAT